MGGSRTMKRFLFALLLCTAGLTGGSTNKLDMENAINLLTDSAAKGECYQSNGATHLDVSDEDMNSIRVEFVKAQILKKLQMKDAPVVGKAVPKLPEPLMHQPRATPIKTHQVKEDEMYATTNEIILLAEHVAIDACESENNSPSSCFTFKIPSDLTPEDINSTLLWVFKHHDVMDNDPNINQTLVYYEIGDNKRAVEIKRHSTNTEDGWITVSIFREVKRWLQEKNFSPILKVACITCGYNKPFTPVSVEGSSKPVLAVNFETNMKKKRPKRNINCMAGVTECCRDELYIDFKDIGWDEWIMEPRGYHAYFCKGSCVGATSATLAGSVHNTIMRKWSVHNKRVSPVPCCAATEHSSLSLIYRSDNNTVTRTTLFNTVVESCGCM